MTRRSIFNDLSPFNTSDQETPEHQPSIADPESDPETLPPSDEEPQSNSETPPPSDEDSPQSNSDGQDEHSSSSSLSSPPSPPGGSGEEAHRWGSCEDTRTTIKPYYGVLASLDRDHTTSLSNHLYSAYLIKKWNLAAPGSGSDSDSSSDSYPDSDSESSTRAKKQRRRGYSTFVGDTLLSKRFITNSWTSWPHPSSHVPRESEHKSGRLRNQPKKFYFDDSTYDKPPQKKGVDAPSQMLEEMLTATFLRVSKEKLWSRPERERDGMVPVLDDDVSAHVLKPVVRSVISKLDGLLVGLYHERRYVNTLMMEDGEEAVEWEGVKGKRKPSQYKQTQARKKAQTARERGVTPMTDTEDDGSFEDEGEGTQSTKNVRPAKSSNIRRRKAAPPKLAKRYAVKRKNRLRLRDWSQVLGIASLTGWDEDTLQKTVKRCEGQFEQRMSWRRLKQDDHLKGRSSGEVWTGARLKRPMGDRNNNDGYEGAVNRDGFMMPIKGVGRKKRVVLKPSQKKRRKMKARNVEKEKGATITDDGDDGDGDDDGDNCDDGGGDGDDGDDGGSGGDGNGGDGDESGEDVESNEEM